LLLWHTDWADTTAETRSTLAPLHTQTRAGRWTSFSPGSCMGVERNATTNQVSSKHIMNCFQHIPESCGALHNPCVGAPQQRGPLTPQTQTNPNRLHTHTHPPERLAHPRLPIPPLSTLTSRATHAHPTSPHSTGFCGIWDCISSSSWIEEGRWEKRKRRQKPSWEQQLLECTVTGGSRNGGAGKTGRLANGQHGREGGGGGGRSGERWTGSSGGDRSGATRKTFKLARQTSNEKTESTA